jgi:hypothetical protein
MAERSASHQPESISYTFPTGGMSMGGAEATAPPIFSRETFANIQAQRLKKSCIITCESRIVTENSHEKTLPYHVFVRHSLVRHPARDALRPECVRSGGSCGCFKVHKENQAQKQEAKDSEGSPRQA